MSQTSKTLKLVAGLVASAGAAGAAVVLGGGHGAVAANTPAVLLAGVAAGALIHIPAHYAIQLLETATHSVERRVEALLQGGRPVSNEDALRAGRRCALSGLGSVTGRFVLRAKFDGEHDLKVAKQFRDGVCAWIEDEQKATHRKDRPDKGSWTKSGFCLEAIEHLAGPKRARKARLEEEAWKELTEAMAAAGVAIPSTFRPYFAGEQHCGAGWREAGHLFLMHEFKTNRDAYVGYQLDTLARLEERLAKLCDEFEKSRGPAPPPARAASPKRQRTARPRRSSPGQSKPSKKSDAAE